MTRASRPFTLNVMSPRSVLPGLVVLGVGLSGCTGKGGGGGTDGFQLVRIASTEHTNLQDATLLQNESITFTFNDNVDFSSVSLNTISLQTISGAPATGAFSMPVSNQVVFQPTCPTLEDGSDSGLMAGQTYVLKVLGRTSGAVNSVRSAGGQALEVTQTRTFSTVSGFSDTPGAPSELTTRLDVGPDTSFPLGTTPLMPPFGNDLDGNGQIDEDEEVKPLNLHSDLTTRVAVVIDFDQALDPSESNISPALMRLEFLLIEDDPVTPGVDESQWVPLDTKVTLEANCTPVQGGDVGQIGGRVRLEPVGILPPGREIRAVLKAGLQDLTLQSTDVDNANFALFFTPDLEFASLSDGTTSDELPESFDFGGSSSLSDQDTEALLETATADWGGGFLTAAFSFAEGDTGDGGPGGDFDWVVQDGESILVDTDGSTIFSSDGRAQVIAGTGPLAGLIDVRNLIIEDRAVVRVQGSNPLRINATGSVLISGLLDVSGFDGADVAVLNSGDFPELGGAPGPGGGRGGNASEVVTSSTARGSLGQGPLNEFNRGGQGGETGFAAVTAPKEARRPGGGAGGRFAVTIADGSGGDGSATATGATTGQMPPRGGVVQSGPFVDGDTSNDFFGTKVVGTPGNVTGLIRGELTSLWGGYGGGGGGNADPATIFPTPNWTPASDEKGGAGGGGGGTLHLRALGPIQFGVNGEIRSNGGLGGRGENVLGEDHIGGSGGSGSGGHIVIETASSISSARLNAVGGARVRPTSTADNTGSGGPGGPGVIQIHVPQPLTNPPAGVVSSPPAEVLVPAFGSISVARSKWIPLGQAHLKPNDVNGNPVTALVNFLFLGTDEATGAIRDDDADGFVDELAPLVDADVAALGAIEGSVTLRIDDATLRFTGQIDGFDDDLFLRNPALLEDFLVRLSVGTAVQDFSVAAAAFADGADQLRLTVTNEAGSLQDFAAAHPGTLHVRLIPRFFGVLARLSVPIDDATWSEAAKTLTKPGAFNDYVFRSGDTVLVSAGTGATAGVYEVASRVSADAISLEASIGAAANGQADIDAVLGGELRGAKPTSTTIRIRFQAADEDQVPLDPNFTNDISDFNLLGPGDARFFRFEVEFDLGVVSSDTEPIRLDFLKVPFVF